MTSIKSVAIDDRWNLLIPEEDLAFTADETFTADRPDGEHVYSAACDFAVSHLGPGNGKQCLVVGSAPFEVYALESAGWRTSLLDIRCPQDFKLNWIKGDAAAIPFPDDSFDALSSTCCYCHVGLGRYNDPRYEDGDYVALMEAFRVLKSGTRAAVMLGPSIPTVTDTHTLGIVHRVYSLSGAVNLLQKVGFRILESGIWEAMNKVWLDLDEVERHYGKYQSGDGVPYSYLDFLLEKPAQRQKL